jgi:hypothetical protein
MKVGLLSAKSELTFIQRSFVTSLLEQTAIDLYVIQMALKESSSDGRSHLNNKPAPTNILSHSMLKFQAFVELQVLKRFMGQRAWYEDAPLQDSNGIQSIKAQAVNSEAGVILSFADKDLKALQQSKLDVLISLDGPIPISNLSEIAQLGLLYTSCDKAKDQYTTTAGFWPVYRKEPSTGFCIGFKSAVKQEDTIAFLGHRGTKDLCWQYNLYMLQKECYHHLEKLLINMASGKALREMEASVFVADNRLPKWYHYLAYNWQLLRTIIKKIKNQLTKTDDYWTVYLHKGALDSLDFNAVTKIENPKGGFFADPFVYRHDNRDILFVEEFVIREKKAVLSALELHENGHYNYLGEVIREPFHLSYPFIFEYDNVLYMVPESSGGKSIRLYKCTAFPLQWEYQYDLISDVVVADTTIIERDGKYWLFTNPREQDSEHNSILDCYVSDSPISQNWKPHSNNPIFFGNGARNGGFLYDNKEGLMVFQTYGLNLYGKSLQIKQLKTLSETEFDTELIKEFEPSLMPGIEGIHHMVSNGRYTVFDTLKKQPLRE